MGRLKEKYTDNDYQIDTLYGIEAATAADKMTVCKSRPMLSLPQTSLTLMELKLFDVYLGRINPRDPSVNKVVFSKQEFCNLLGVNKINNSKLELCLEHLMKCVVKVHKEADGKATTDIVSLLSHARITYHDRYYKDLCAVELQCTKEAKKYIYNIDTVGYLRMNLARVLSFDGRNPYSLYQYLNQNTYRGHWEVGIDELKEYLGVSNKYKDIKDFERRVLIPCKKEIEDKTDLRFEYDKIKVGRRIQKIKFQIIKQQEPEIEEPKTFDDDYIPFAKDGERIELGHYKFDDEVPNYTAEDYNNDDFINQFRPDKRPRRRW